MQHGGHGRYSRAKIRIGGRAIASVDAVADKCRDFLLLQADTVDRQQAIGQCAKALHGFHHGLTEVFLGEKIVLLRLQNVHCVRHTGVVGIGHHLPVKRFCGAPRHRGARPHPNQGMGAVLIFFAQGIGAADALLGRVNKPGVHAHLKASVVIAIHVNAANTLLLHGFDAGVGQIIVILHIVEIGQGSHAALEALHGSNLAGKALETIRHRRTTPQGRSLQPLNEVQICAKALQQRLKNMHV